MGQNHACRSRPAMHGSWSAGEVNELRTLREKNFHPRPKPSQAILHCPRPPSKTQDPQSASAVPHKVLAEQAGEAHVANGLPAVRSKGERHSPQRHAIRRRVAALLVPPWVSFLPPGWLGEGWRPLSIPMFAAWPRAGGWSGLSSCEMPAEPSVPLANWEFCSELSSSSAPLPPGSFASCEALTGGDPLPHAAASLVIGLRNSELFQENVEQTKPSRHSGPVSYVPAPAGTSAAVVQVIYF